MNTSIEKKNKKLSTLIILITLLTINIILNYVLYWSNIGYWSILISLIVSLLFVFFPYLFDKKLILWLCEAKPANQQQNEYIKPILERLWNENSISKNSVFRFIKITIF
jgi:hypothetical protein